MAEYGYFLRRRVEGWKHAYEYWSDREGAWGVPHNSTRFGVKTRMRRFIPRGAEWYVLVMDIGIGVPEVACDPIR